MENPYHEALPRCPLCDIHVDYKNTQLLSQFVSPFTGRILGAEVTGLCKKKQKQLSKAIKRAQNAAFLPVIHKDPTFIHDPRILADKQTTTG
uniref:small ribosomal subunit protein bS18m n=1 Tax=Myxine glutinosa TaxID=7769 RepID=UPI00358F89CB